MMSDWIVLDSLEALDRLIASSDQRLVLLFKHSATCGTSAQAHDELILLGNDRHAAAHAIITVQTHRDISDAVATRLNIRHETPQALLIKDGNVVWEASHFQVTAEIISDAIAQHSS